MTHYRVKEAVGVRAGGGGPMGLGSINPASRKKMINQIKPKIINLRSNTKKNCALNIGNLKCQSNAIRFYATIL